MNSVSNQLNLEYQNDGKRISRGEIRIIEDLKLNNLIENAETVWLSSDWHLYYWKDKNPQLKMYKSENYDYCLNNHKKMIKPNDLLIFMGDLVDGEYANKNQLKAIIQSLNFKKILVKGNNDLFDDQYYYSCGFLYVLEGFKYKNLIFSHAPIKHNKSTINIHGHLHGKKDYWIGYNNHLDIAAYNRYKPITLERALEKYKNGDYAPENNTGIQESSSVKVDDKMYAIPEEKKFPLYDKNHVLSAVKFFNYIPKRNEERLAKAIIKRIHELNMEDEVNVGPKNKFKNYYTSPKQQKQEQKRKDIKNEEMNQIISSLQRKLSDDSNLNEKVKFNIDENGTITVILESYKKLDAILNRCYKDLRYYKSNNNIDGVKYELCRLYYINIHLNSIIRNEKLKEKKPELVEKAQKLSTHAGSTLKMYMDWVQKKDNSFIIDKEYKNSDFYKNKFTLTLDNIRGIKKLITTVVEVASKI